MEWAIESVPEEVIKDYTLKQIKVTFEKETSYGDKVHVAANIIKEDEDIIIVKKEGVNYFAYVSLSALRKPT